MPDQGLFKFAFAVFILEVEELQQVRVAHLVLDGHRVFRLRYLPFRQHGSLAFRVRRPLVELGVDLPVQLPHGPAAPDGLGLVERLARAVVTDISRT